jgi:CheY-like chemotaxis protein
LGLSITRQLVELMKGSIQVESLPGQGSIFRVAIPMELADRSEVLQQRGGDRRVRRIEPNQPEYRLLIVEDQKENQVILERILTGAGFKVDVAGDGVQGIEKYHSFRPHLIWMDLRMPEMDGLEAAQHIRASEGGNDVRIVAVTASAFESEREDILAHGMDDYIRKPYRPDEIYDCLARQLGVRFRGEAGQALQTDARGLKPEAVARLSAKVRSQLYNALVSLDAERIMAAIGVVEEEDHALAEVLREHAGAFGYTAIMNALELVGRAAKGSA